MDKVTKEIKEQINSNKVLLFMKGSPYQPQCGFSAKVAQIMFSYDVEFSYIDVLEFPEVRSTLPSISDWPTFPQLFVDGELVGGCDIVTELDQILSNFLQRRLYLLVSWNILSSQFFIFDVVNLISHVQYVSLSFQS